MAGFDSHGAQDPATLTGPELTTSRAPLSMWCRYFPTYLLTIGDATMET